MSVRLDLRGCRGIKGEILSSERDFAMKTVKSRAFELYISGPKCWNFGRQSKVSSSNCRISARRPVPASHSDNEIAAIVIETINIGAILSQRKFTIE